MKWPTLPFLFIAFFCAPRAHALIYLNDAVFPELATSARALAMGNAYVAKADDTSAVFYNPAGLGTVRKTHLHLSNIHVEVNRDWMHLSTGGRFTDASSNFGKSLSINGIRQLLLQHRGRVSFNRFHVLPNFTTRYFSLGYLYSRRSKATIGRQKDLFEYHARQDHGPYGALNISFFGGVFKFGVSAILLNRKEGIGESAAEQDVSVDYNSGTALIGTAGTKLTLPFKFLPTFAAKVNNAFRQDFKGTNPPPGNIPQSLDVGFSITPQIAKRARFHFEVNYKDLNNKFPGTGAARKITGGMELDIARLLFFRFGWSDGFGSAGIGLMSQHLEVALTTYGVYTVSREFEGKEDRRFIFSVSSGF